MINFASGNSELMNTYLHTSFKVFYKHLLRVCCLIFCASSAYSQVKFTAVCNDRKIGKNDYLQIQYQVDNAANVQGITPPAFKDFYTISGPNQQTSMSNINGNVKQSVSIGFVLRPKSAGNFTIPPAIATVDGKEYRSNPVSVEVTNASSLTKSGGGNTFASPFGNLTLDLPSEPTTHQFDDYILHKGENVDEKIKKNLFVRIDVNKTSCYVGEPIVATYKLYTRLKSESNVLKTPSFNGFSVSELEMPGNYSVTSEKYKGRDYNVYTLRKVQLYPLQSGPLVLDPVEVENKITFLKSEYAGSRRGDIFYDMLRDFADETVPAGATEERTINITGNPLTINVKPLPDANKPSQFKGAVGDFKINAELDKKNITTDDAGSLKVTISGEGNIQMINAPKVQMPEGIDVFDPKSVENIDKFSVPMKGDKTFIYPFSAAKPGDYELPSIEFSYFNPSSQSYKTIKTQPLTVHIIKGTGNPSRTKIASTPSNMKHNPTIADSLYEYRWYLGGGAVLLTALIFLFKEKKQKPVPVIKELPPIAKEPAPVAEAEVFLIPANPLAPAEEKLIENDATQFYKVMDVCLKNYLSEKLKVPAEELTKKKINERLDKCNVSVGTSLLLTSLLEDIELNLYAPVSSETQMQEVYEKASEVVSLLDKQVC